jgi:hypothetical protein
MFRNRLIFYSEGLFTPRPVPMLEDHPLSSVRGSLFNVFAANLHSRRPSLYPRPEEALCCGDRDPPNMEVPATSFLNPSFTDRTEIQCFYILTCCAYPCGGGLEYLHCSPGALGYDRATLPLGNINIGRSSRLGAGHRSKDIVL